MKTPEGEKTRISVLSGGLNASLVGLILTPILVNVLGGLAFSGHRSHQSAQGLGSLLFFLGILSAPLGALYWGVVTWLMRAPFNSRRLVLPAAIYFLSVLVAVMAIGRAYTSSR